MNFPEDPYIRQLNRFLRTGNLTAFERLMDKLHDDGISIDITQIPDIEGKISNLFVHNLQTGMNINEIFRILKFANDYQLFCGRKIERLFPISETNHEMITANLESLFGDLSDGFFNFIVSSLPDHLSNFLVNRPNVMMFNYNLPLKEIINSIYYYIDIYTNYGLRTRKIGTFKDYYQLYERRKEKFDEDYFAFKIKKSDLLGQDRSLELVRVFAEIMSPFERHLVYAPLLKKTKKKFEHGEYKYEYPIVGMVITGGIGPEGKGFVYLTPRGEIIEVCSDAKQNRAYIIEYKKYLKSIFLQKLELRMQSWKISEKLKHETLNFFNTNIHTKMVDYHAIDALLEKDIFTYLQSKVKSYSTPEFFTFLRKSILEILIPVQMEDQFKVRMDLIKKNQLTETEVAKLVSLGTVSHFDVLNQRLFFLILVDNIARILKLQKKL
ncbi:MAG: hypothetical protein HWN66_12265 [Candidatus Helarchaeota archaeon]|nr:hypothetical protein [Candidatus Helarchaeota archaeon]